LLVVVEAAAFKAVVVLVDLELLRVLVYLNRHHMLLQ
jgi:hypothetical protein